MAGMEDTLSAVSGRILEFLPGVLLTAAVASAAWMAGSLLPAFGAPLFAILAGAVVATVRPLPSAMRPGVAFCSRPVLQASVVVLGTGLSLSEVASVGAGSLPVLLGTLAVALLLAWPVGRALGLSRDLTTLIGIGTAICGASAIAAADSVIEADDSDVAYAVTTIFLFNVLALLTYPYIGRGMGMTQHQFGVWAGTAVNDLSSVVAAATIFGHPAAASAVVVKLTRTLAIVPTCVGLAVVQGRRGTRAGGTSISLAVRTIPVFLLGFVATAGVNSVGLIPASWHGGLGDLSTMMITVALGAVGLSTRPAAFRRAGWRPLALGAVLWFSVAASSLALQAMTGLA